MQRLRRVAQTSLTSTVYPGATGSRFEHALGTMHLARRAWAGVCRNSAPKTLTELKFRLIEEARLEDANVEIPHDDSAFQELASQAVGAVGLLHDVGHPPFSHVLEPIFQRNARTWLEGEAWDRYESVWAGQFHEAAGALLARQVTERLEEPLRTLTRLTFEANPGDLDSAAGCLHSLVAGEIDVDRLDYLMRDGQKAGTEFGAIDFERLVDALELKRPSGQFRIAPGSRARSAVETVLIQRTQSYKWIIFHHRVVGTNLALQHAVKLAWELSVRDDATVRMWGDEIPVAELFGPLRPNLNYLAPRLTDVERTIRLSLSKAPSQRQTPIRKTASVLVQAAVDDHAVVHWLHRATALARILRDAETDVDTARKLSLLVTHSNAALLRTKQFISAWETVEDFARVADVLVTGGGLTTKLREIAGEVLESCDDRQRTVVERVTAETLSPFAEQDRVSALNMLFRTFFSVAAHRTQLTGLLEQAGLEALAGHEGFWEVTYTGFTAVETNPDQLTQLYAPGRQDPISLLDTSPLVKALVGAERHRPSLFVFFFVTADGLAGDPRPQSLGGRMLQASFKTAFMQFVDEAWRPHLEGLAGLRKGSGPDAQA